ncbi:MAG: AAA family ATPase, partial [Miltoncostaeaceae bacterium]
RLCSAAEAGQTLASEGLIHLAGPVSGLEYAPQHAISAKGLDEPVGVVAVSPADVDPGRSGPAVTLGVPPPIPPQLDPIVPLAGRGEELGWLRWHWRRARHGHARCVVVSGIPGIGKTRLAAGLAAIAHEDDARVSYLPMARGIAEAALAARADGQPALLVVDDIDAAAGDLVRATVDEAAALAGPVLLLVTHRTEASAELVRALADLTPSSMRRELGPLDLEAVRMIASLYAGDAVDQLPLGDIAEQTGGHPASIHRLSHEWAKRLATQRVGASAGRAETDRRSLQDAEAALIEDISLLGQAREGGLLYDDRPDLADPGTEPRSRPTGGCPYKGLEPYAAADADLFFGRERLVAELTARLVGSPFLAIVGASGSGKSSVIGAGLLPSLAGGALPGSDTWAQVSMRPGQEPASALSQALCRRFDGLCDEDREVGPLLEAALATLPQGGRLVLSVDQFEEVFATGDAAERTTFLDTICGEHPGLLVVVALRADHYGHAAAYPALARLLASHHVLVGTLTRGELVAVIERPAERVGLQVEPELVDALTADAGAEPSVLPLLSTALLEAWTLRDGDRLTLATYQAGGGLHGSVARLAEGVWTALDPDRQAVARAILLRLAGESETEGFVRRSVPLAEFDLEDDPMAAEVLERLVSARLLTTEDDTVEVTHEALLREWPRLRAWLEEDASGHQLHLHLAAAAREWDADGRPAGDLYRGARLSGALDWSAEHPEQLNAVEREFLEASTAATEQEVERQRRTNRNLRVLVAGIGVLLVVAIGAGVFASLEAQRAEEQAQRAESERLVARASELAASSLLELDTDPSLSKLLALKAADIDPRTNVLSGLHTALAADKVERRVPVTHAETGQRSWTRVDPSGRWVVMSGPRVNPRGQMEVFDLETNAQEPVWTFQAEPGALIAIP